MLVDKTKSFRLEYEWSFVLACNSNFNDSKSVPLYDSDDSLCLF
jgi:hypothetical protein